MRLASAAVAAAVAAAGACTRPAEQRALAELDVGTAELGGTTVEVAGGLAAVRALDAHRLELWSQAPALDLALRLEGSAAGAWTIVARNVVADAELVVDGVTYTRAPGDRPTVATFRDVPLAAGPHALRIAPPDAALVAPFRVAALADIQTALPTVHEVFERISAVPDVRFLVGMGDLTQRAEVAEYELFEAQLVALDVPYYTTLGNHELWADPARFFTRFGRASFHFEFKGAAFTFADSGDGGLDPLVEEWIVGWLDGARDLTHVFLTHFPPVDPVGARYGAFRSARDGHRLISRLADGDVDLALYGHIHTYIPFTHAGIPSFVSGGGGAEPSEKLDGIERHFLVVDLDPAAPSAGAGEAQVRVDVRRVDP